MFCKYWCSTFNVGLRNYLITPCFSLMPYLPVSFLILMFFPPVFPLPYLVFFNKEGTYDSSILNFLRNPTYCFFIAAYTILYCHQKYKGSNLFTSLLLNIYIQKNWSRISESCPHSHITATFCNSPSMETTWIFIDRWMDKMWCT